MDNKYLIQLFALFITIFLLVLLFNQINLEDVTTILTTINPVYLVIGFIIYLCSYIMRALRFFRLLNKQVHIKCLFPIVCLHNMLINLLPARTGEFSYIYLLKKISKRPAAEGFATLIIARIFDFIIIVVFFISISFFMNEINPELLDVVVFAAAFLFLIISFLFFLLMFGFKFLNLINIFFSFIKIEKYWVIQSINKKSAEIIKYFEDFKSLSTKEHVSIIAISLGIWLLTYALMYSLSIAMNIQLNWIQILFASSFSIFSTILPIQGIAGFGTVEMGWAIGFIAVGLSKEMAISTGFGFHIIILIYNLILGMAGYLYLNKIKKKPILSSFRE